MCLFLMMMWRKPYRCLHKPFLKRVLIILALFMASFQRMSSRHIASHPIFSLKLAPILKILSQYASVAINPKPETPSAQVLMAFKAHNTPMPSANVETSKEEVMSMFLSMNVMRRAEITADMLFKKGLVKGFCHLYDGQEAIAVGISAALSNNDSILTAYRDHCFFLAKHGTPYELFCELLGKSDGCCSGKGGSMHLVKRKDNFFGGWGIVGASGPLGTGLALGHKLEGKEGIAVSIFGDGAANQGQIFEACNMAALWKLPVVYVVENNHVGMGTTDIRASAQPTFYNRLSYLPGLWVDGMDVFAVKQAMSYAKEFTQKEGPIVLEMDTYRYHGHSMSDPGNTYRQRSEIQEMRQLRDCIARLQQFIIENSIMTGPEIKSLQAEVKAAVQNDAERAQKASTPDASRVWTHVYSSENLREN